MLNPNTKQLFQYVSKGSNPEHSQQDAKYFQLKFKLTITEQVKQHP